MSKKKRKSKGKKGDLWAEAKRRCRLNQEQLRMAQEMGLNPRKLIGNRPNPSEPWKGPVGEWIEFIYDRRQEKAARKRRRRAAAEASAKSTASAPRSASPPRPKPPPQPAPEIAEVAEAEEQLDPFVNVEDVFVDDVSTPEEDQLPLQLELFDALDETEEQVRREAVEDDQRNVERHRHFGEVAKWVAAAMAEIPSVQRVVLFGSAALPPTRGVPRWRRYRGLGLEIEHHCKDVDLAVWLDDLSCLRALQRARNVTANEYYRATSFGVAQHQIDVFVMEHGTDRYLGRLCDFNECPRDGKMECRVPGCGHPQHLRQHEDFTLKAEALAPENSVVLLDRDAAAESDG
jgi:hypothetical protein